MVCPPVTRAAPGTLELRPAPIPPDWILEGRPDARVASISRSASGAMWTDLWDCTAGRFEWRYEVDETITIVEGGAIVTDANGTVWPLKPGDVASFRAGTRAHWHVPTYVRKIAVCAHPMPNLVMAVGDFAKRLRRRARSVAAAAGTATAFALGAAMLVIE
ncbi:MAG: DUF861 domain-containing protein [Alphaproteobacteria bacterium]|nr:DUF861 domain-containing protein [Alphaproteobacteria bacterium]